LLMSQRRQPCALCGQLVWSCSSAHHPILSQQNRISRRGQKVVCIAPRMVGRGKTGAAYSLEFSNCARTAMMSVVWCSFGSGLVGKGERKAVFGFVAWGTSEVCSLWVVLVCLQMAGWRGERKRQIYISAAKSKWGSLDLGSPAFRYRTLRHAELMTVSLMHETRYFVSLVQGPSVHLGWQVEAHVLDLLVPR